MNPLLQLEDVHVHLGGKRRWFRPEIPSVKAVGGVSLDVRAGEILGVVGESGCGKTTLGRTILGLQRETRGTVRLDGRVVSGRPPRQARRDRRAIQYVHQDPGAALDPWWSIGHSLEEGLVITGRGEKRRRQEIIEQALTAVGLDPTARRRYPHEFSGGQLRRIGLARILILDPRIVILDEPTSGLDMSVQATVLNLLLEIRAERDLTYLFISHDLSVVRRLCDRVAVMYLGRIVELAPADRLFGRPLHPYAQALLAAAPRLEPGETRQIAIRGEPPSASRLPSGCLFASRCPYVEPECRSEEQVLRPAAPEHEVACRRWKEIAAGAAPTVGESDADPLAGTAPSSSAQLKTA
jgi:oligopeptide/dipeptide ABC transporter ATP-binding protein